MSIHDALRSLRQKEPDWIARSKKKKVRGKNSKRIRVESKGSANSLADLIRREDSG